MRAAQCVSLIQWMRSPTDSFDLAMADTLLVVGRPPIPGVQTPPSHPASFLAPRLLLAGGLGSRIVDRTKVRPLAGIGLAAELTSSWAPKNSTD